MDRYGTEAKCEAALAEQRWPSGFVCPRCQDDRHSCFERGHQRLWQCHRCHHQVSITAGTIFENTKLPLTKWFLAMFFMTQFKNNISALCLKRHLGVSYDTAWLLKHKLMTVMGETEANRELAVRVEIDDAYLGEAVPARRDADRRTRCRSSRRWKRLTMVGPVTSGLILCLSPMSASMPGPASRWRRPHTPCRMPCRVSRYSPIRCERTRPS